MVLNRISLIGIKIVLVLLLGACASRAPDPAPTPEWTPPAVPPVTSWRAPRVGLALGGGAARGFAHVGVIQVLEERGIRPDVVVGTSAGSLVATLYASGMGARELERLALTMDEALLTDWSLPIMGRGMLRGEALARYVRQAVDGRLLEDMKMPVGVLATDLGSGEGVLFRRGDAGEAVRASSAVPGVFTPVRINGRSFVDGGLVAPVPVRFARQMGAEVVIAVDISSDPQGNSPDGLLRLLLQTTAIMGKSINRHEMASAEVQVRPQLSGVGSADFASRQRSIEAGRAAMEAALPGLQVELARLRPVPVR